MEEDEDTLVAKDWSMTKKAQHVVPSEGGWSVIGAGASRATRVFKTKEQAVDLARHIAEKEGSELYVHGSDGRIKERRSYGGGVAVLKG